MKALSEVSGCLLIQDECGDATGKGPKAGDIVAQHGPSDIEAQVHKRLCTGSVYNAAYFDFMRADSAVTIICSARGPQRVPSVPSVHDGYSHYFAGGDRLLWR